MIKLVTTIIAATLLTSCATYRYNPGETVKVGQDFGVIYEVLENGNYKVNVGFDEMELNPSDLRPAPTAQAPVKSNF